MSLLDLTNRIYTTIMFFSGCSDPELAKADSHLRPSVWLLYSPPSPYPPLPPQTTWNNLPYVGGFLFLHAIAAPQIFKVRRNCVTPIHSKSIVSSDTSNPFWFELYMDGRPRVMVSLWQHLSVVTINAVLRPGLFDQPIA